MWEMSALTAVAADSPTPLRPDLDIAMKNEIG
jgi:hypothetical protein